MTVTKRGRGSRLGAADTAETAVTGLDLVGLDETGVGGKKFLVSNADDLSSWLAGREEKRGVYGTP